MRKTEEQNETLFYDWETDSMTKEIRGFCRISWRCIRESAEKYGTSINSPERIVELLNKELDMANLDREYFVAIYLDRKGYINAYEIVSIGGLHSSIVHPREVFKPAILTSSASIILAHNHPTGDPTPSQEDRDVTNRLREAGKIMGITVLDHIIIGVGRYISFQEKGL
ncbi:RadC family protein [Bacteroides sp.]|uniref:JAB domain-containing protein n=1 Tax=Bacteroides sp. TaxID=29523 RepID=UPI00261C98A2|nr:DNA repair protein RadC [Bacteroides sp.]MDD3040434.1 DNA repair protein RadC [Bacteroides sp.]